MVDREGPCGVDPELVEVGENEGKGETRLYDPCLSKGLSGKGVVQGWHQSLGKQREHRTLGQMVVIFFDALPRVFWERVRLIYHLTYKGPQHSSISD